MTRDEFEAGYCERSEITVAEFRQIKVTLPCACQEPGCEGWAAIGLETTQLLHHLGFYLPERDVLMALQLQDLRTAHRR